MLPCQNKPKIITDGSTNVPVTISILPIILIYVQYLAFHMGSHAKGINEHTCFHNSVSNPLALN
jgi:hypothetical protein